MSSSAPLGNPAPSAEARESRQAPRGSRWWLWLLVLIVLGYAGWRMFGRSSADPQAQTPAAGRGRMALSEVPVVLATAKQGDIGVYVSALGTVTPVNTVTVTSRVQGQIMEIHYREGQMVRKGDPLLEIDSRPYRAALTQVEGQLAHDMAQLNQARIDFERYKAAYSRNAIAKQQLDDQEQAVKQFEGTVKNDEGVVENAKVNLIYCHITSPIDGRVGLRLVDVGNIVQANSNTGLVVVAQLQPITVIFNVAEDYLGAIQSQLLRGKTLEVDVYDRSIEKLLAKGMLLTVDNQIDTSTGTVKLRAQFANHDSALFPNQFVNARLLVDTLHDVTLVPTSAIQRNAQGAYLYVIKQDQTAAIRQVKEGTTDGGNTSVQGVNAGETIATDGFDKLQEGVKVKARGAGSGGAQAASPGGSADSKGVSKEAATK
jgi:membrane fusion protein, multidrug efflux system